jgi:hypothetical protein
MTVKEEVKTEFDKLLNATLESIGEIKIYAITEAWNILQLLIATLVQVIEIIAHDLAGPEKKKLAMELVSEFYDAMFKRIDLPILPSAIESILHEYIKQILMLLVDSSIDAMVTTFQNIGLFYDRQYDHTITSKLQTTDIVNPQIPIEKFINDIHMRRFK